MVNKSDTIERSKAEILLPDILQAAFDGNVKRLEMLAVTAIRTLRGSSPDLADAIQAIVATRRNPSIVSRTAELEPSPIDQDSSAPLLRIEATSTSPRPVFRAALAQQVERFTNEWRQSERLLGEGFFPSRSILLKGPPGTGKTMFARWLAGELKLKFVTLDLATAISSYLGKTGLNLRRALDYARANSCLLLLDEFDAVAKRRDDATEVGELKRIVNVLLKELEDWPHHSLLVAATNHPELLDPAISRRFDRVFSTDLPEREERLLILHGALARFGAEVKSSFLDAIVEMLSGKSGSDIHTIATAAVRRHIVEKESIETALASELRSASNTELQDSKAAGKLVRALNNTSPHTVRELAALTGLGISTVHYHLKKDSKHANE